MATANPAMSDAVYLRAGRSDTALGVMTLQGTVAKTALLLAILLVTGAYTWSQAVVGSNPVAYGLLMAGMIGGFLDSPRDHLHTQGVPLYGARSMPLWRGWSWGRSLPSLRRCTLASSSRRWA